MQTEKRRPVDRYMYSICYASLLIGGRRSQIVGFSCGQPRRSGRKKAGNLKLPFFLFACLLYNYVWIIYSRQQVRRRLHSQF